MLTIRLSLARFLSAPHSNHSPFLPYSFLICSLSFYLIHSQIARAKNEWVPTIGESILISDETAEIEGDRKLDSASCNFPVTIGSDIFGLISFRCLKTRYHRAVQRVSSVANRLLHGVTSTRLSSAVPRSHVVAFQFIPRGAVSVSCD
ncbi:hypothetical protein LSTR_LSTR010191 [Laodelphax striatellus]|uniref:Uncharacterized protein n=1 Tax=Laodelphax striatellus TaxID=195883 RepID=A0A482WR35_LAOST|nr:hypothetical protein LSTR_LSTR010191 [Laodelphax striatellus]